MNIVSSVVSIASNVCISIIIIKKKKKKKKKERNLIFHSVMASALDTGLISVGSSPCHGNRVVLETKALLLHPACLHLGI